MIDHVSIGARDLARAKLFYDATLGALGYKCLFEGDAGLGYGAEHPAFWVTATEHPVPADKRSGLHICFAAPTRAAVDAFHRAGLSTGGSDNGKPGLRPDYHANYYGAFVVDPDGYRVEAYYGAAA
jgi:catechol 2,3-dioxygenase-like lactoylglutathione lyase family enzyme